MRLTVHLYLLPRLFPMQVIRFLWWCLSLKQLKFYLIRFTYQSAPYNNHQMIDSPILDIIHSPVCI
jgi:hypothetical protein